MIARWAKKKKMEAEISFKGIVFLDFYFFLRDLASGTWGTASIGHVCGSMEPLRESGLVLLTHTAGIVPCRSPGGARSVEHTSGWNCLSCDWQGPLKEIMRSYRGMRTSTCQAKPSKDCNPKAVLYPFVWHPINTCYALFWYAFCFEAGCVTVNKSSEISLHILLLRLQTVCLPACRGRPH